VTEAGAVPEMVGATLTEGGGVLGVLDDGAVTLAAAFEVSSPEQATSIVASSGSINSVRHVPSVRIDHSPPTVQSVSGRCVR
jgi:hypothetical protein